jgi:protein-S-isoprenylcysteine O-methyltransferase Ste14
LLNKRFLPRGTWTFWSGAAITACGLLFSVRARRQLGSKWSQAVASKEDHKLITSGPYALAVRILGSAVAREASGAG